MSDKGIIFAAPMVRALLDGRKTQTRRLLLRPEYYGCPTGDCPHTTQAECNAAMAGLSAKEANGYAPGDRLYVREAWGMNHYKYERGRAPLIRPADLDDGELSYRATEDDCEIRNELRYRPSIHMPRWASRMWLAVTEVRVQRLQDISEGDAIAEGLQHRTWEVEEGDDAEIVEGWSSCRFHAFRHGVGESPCEGYRLLWDSLHTEPGTRWADNPWVVAVSFDVNQGNIDGGAA